MLTIQKFAISLQSLAAKQALLVSDVFTSGCRKEWFKVEIDYQGRQGDARQGDAELAIAYPAQGG